MEADLAFKKKQTAWEHRGIWRSLLASLLPSPGVLGFKLGQNSLQQPPQRSSYNNPAQPSRSRPA